MKGEPLHTFDFHVMKFLFKENIINIKKNIKIILNCRAGSPYPAASHWDASNAKTLFSFFLITLFCLIHTAPARASDEVELGASLRTVAALSRNYDFAPFFGSGNKTDFVTQTLLRVTAEGDFNNRLSFEAHAVQSINHTTAASSSSASALGDFRAMDATLDWSRGRRSSAALWLDRFNVRFTFENSDLTIGRQAVTFGKAWFWNPLDVFMPFDPNQFDRDYKPGVDALRWDLVLGDFSGVTVVAAAGSTKEPPGAASDAPRSLRADWQGSALIARWFTNVNAWDYAVQGGKVYGGWQLGGGAVGEVGPYQLRLEAAQFWARRAPAMPFPYSGNALKDAFTGVVGLGRYFKSSLDIEVEYLFNGAGDPDNLDAAYIRQQYGAMQHLGRHIIGLTAGYEFTPLIHGQFLALRSLSDGSTQTQPVISKSMSDNADLLVGGNFNFGERPQGVAALAPGIRSEFGAWPNSLFLEYKIYF